MTVYVTTVYNIHHGSTITVGVSSTEAKALSIGKEYISTFGEYPCELDWDHFNNTVTYYYDGFTLTIKQFEVDN